MGLGCTEWRTWRERNEQNFLLVPSVAEEMSSCNYLSWQRITLLDCSVESAGGWEEGGGGGCDQFQFVKNSVHGRGGGVVR